MSATNETGNDTIVLKHLTIEGGKSVDETNIIQRILNLQLEKERENIEVVVLMMVTAPSLARR